MKSQEKRQHKTPTIFLTDYLMVLIPNISRGWPGWKQLWNSILSKSVFFNFPFFYLKLLNLFRGESPHEGRRDHRRSKAGLAGRTRRGCVTAVQNCHSTCRSSQAVQKHHTNTLTPALCVTHQLLSDLFSSKAKQHGERSEKCKTKWAKCSTPDRQEACMRNNICAGLTITCVLTPVVDPVGYCIGSNLKIQSCVWKLPQLGPA